MNRQMNLPALQRIAMEFEKENDIMDQRQEMMDDAIDDATGMEDEEESEDVVNQVLDEIGIDLGQAVCTKASLIEPKLTLHSSARHLVACKRQPFLRGEWHRQLGVPIPATMICRLGWTALEDKQSTPRDNDSTLRCPSNKLRNTKHKLWFLHVRSDR